MNEDGEPETPYETTDEDNGIIIATLNDEGQRITSILKYTGALPKIGNERVLYMLFVETDEGETYEEYLWNNSTKKYDLIDPVRSVISLGR